MLGLVIKAGEAFALASVVGTGESFVDGLLGKWWRWGSFMKDWLTGAGVV